MALFGTSTAPVDVQDAVHSELKVTGPGVCPGAHDNPQVSALACTRIRDGVSELIPIGQLGLDLGGCRPTEQQAGLALLHTEQILAPDGTVVSSVGEWICTLHVTTTQSGVPLRLQLGA